MIELLTTDSVEPSDRVAYWREIICAVYVQLDAEALVGDTFSGSVQLTSWGDVRLSKVASDGQVVQRQPNAPQSDCLLSLQVAGTGRVSQSGRTAVLQPGDFALYDATRPYRLAFDDSFSQLVVQFPRDALVARNINLEAAVATNLSGAQGVGAVAASFIRTLAANGHNIPEAQRAQLGEHVLDFTATALASRVGLPTVHESKQAFDRQRVLNHIDQNLADPRLSVASVAEDFGVSTRTLQKLFATQEVQLARHIRLVRVARAKRLLLDPLRSHHSITRISQDAGFSSPALFARVFRAECGCSPRDFRAANGSVVDG